MGVSYVFGRIGCGVVGGVRFTREERFCRAYEGRGVRVKGL